MKSILSIIIVTLFLIGCSSQEETFEMAVNKKMENILSDYEFINSYSLSGDSLEVLTLNIDDFSNKYTIQDKYRVLSEVWVDFYNNHRALLLTKSKLSSSDVLYDPNKRWVEVVANTSKDTYKLIDGGITDKDGTEYRLNVFTGSLENNSEIQEKLLEEEKRLRTSPPYKGMHESDISKSLWGEPNEIELSQDYDSKRPSHQFKYYTWIIKNNSGQVTEIRTLTVNQGFVFGEPKVHKYYIE